MPKQFLVRRRSFRRMVVNDDVPSSSTRQIGKFRVAFSIDVAQRLDTGDLGSLSTDVTSQFSCDDDCYRNRTVAAVTLSDADSALDNCSECNCDIPSCVTFDNDSGSTSQASIRRANQFGREYAVACELQDKQQPAVRVTQNTSTLIDESQLRLQSSTVSSTEMTASGVQKNVDNWQMTAQQPVKTGSVGDYAVRERCCVHDRFARNALLSDGDCDSGGNVFSNAVVGCSSLTAACEVADRRKRLICTVEARKLATPDDVSAQNYEASSSSRVPLSPLAIAMTRHVSGPEAAVGSLWTPSDPVVSQRTAVCCSVSNPEAASDVSWVCSSVERSGTGASDECETTTAMARATASVMLSRIENRLGDFVCRLCDARFGDAFQLAGHRCRRIRSAEHRCAECNKTFGCPANLASHQRWHRRRNGQVVEKVLDKRYWSINGLPGARGKGFRGCRRSPKVAVADETATSDDTYGSNGAIVDLSLN